MVTKRERMSALKRNKARVDLSAFTTEWRQKIRAMAQNYARQEVLDAHQEEYRAAYVGWQEAIVEQINREGIESIGGTEE